MLALPAAAADAPPGAESGLITGLFVGLAATGAAMVLAAVLYWRERRRTIVEQASRQLIDDELTTLLDALPGGAMVWRGKRDAARTTVTPGLTHLLGAEPGSIGSFDDLAQHLAAAHFERLSEEVEALRSHGVPFSGMVSDPSGERLLEVHGTPVGGGSGQTSALWINDITARGREIKALSGQLEERDGLAQARRTRLESVALPVWERDAEGELVWCNGAYAKRVETTPEDAVANGVELAPVYAPSLAAPIAREALASGETCRGRRHAVIRGARCLLEITETPAPSGDGTVGFAVDVTPLEESQDELARHIAAHAQVLDTLGSSIEIYGPDQRLTYYNSVFPKMFRFDETQLENGPTINEVIDAMRENRRIPEQADFTAFKHEQSELFTSLTEPREGLIHLPDGTALREIVTPHPFGGLMFICEDVTDRLTLEASFNTLNAVQRATLDNLYEGVAVFGGDGRLRLYNPVYARLWNLSESLLETRPHIAEIVDASRELLDDGGDWETYRADLIGRTVDHSRQAERFERRDGSVLDFASVPLPDGATLNTYIDVTDSIEVERMLRERNEALEHADRLKSEFIANVSYELRTPLNTMIGFTEILANQFFGSLNARQAEYATGILESSQQLLALINDMLDLASIEAGHVVLEVEPVELRALLEGVAKLFTERARGGQIELSIECPQDIGSIDMDKRRTKQILFNLMSNALKFTPRAGTVVLGARRAADDGAALWVADSGVGIPESDRERIFDKFYTAEHRSRGRAGPGLALALVKSFVELHGGRVEIDSTPGEGTTVACHFPRRPPQGETLVPPIRLVSEN